MEYITKSKDETENIAKEIALSAKRGDLFALSGDLGSGKTTFTKGFARGLGVEEEITSPTFVIFKQYRAKAPINNFVHVDCYRLESSADAESVGLLEIIEQKNSIVLIEWPEKIMEAIPKEAKLLNFEYIDENTRRITIE